MVTLTIWRYQRFNLDYASTLGPFISTDAQGDWWGGYGGGTVAHAAIACFLGDTSEAMLAFSQVLPKSVPRIALVDFNNDSVGDSLDVCKAMFERYRQLIEAGQPEKAERYRLYGVRLDTSAALRDRSVTPLATRPSTWGSTPAWFSWCGRRWMQPGNPGVSQPIGKAGRGSTARRLKLSCRAASTLKKSAAFETLGVPVDIYCGGLVFVRQPRANRNRLYRRRGADKSARGVDRHGQNWPAFV